VISTLPMNLKSFGAIMQKLWPKNKSTNSVIKNSTSIFCIQSLKWWMCINRDAIGLKARNGYAYVNHNSIS